jgi:hypothetical protein
MDVYQKLRPLTQIESCECETVNGLLLVDLLTDNPIHCSTCRKEVDPQRLGLTVSETESVASWFSVASALYRLWLDSGAYEAYAKAELIDPQGQVNRDGVQLARMLSTRLPTRLWLFHDPDDPVPSHCPVCGQTLETDVKWGTECPNCPILIGL